MASRITTALNQNYGRCLVTLPQRGGRVVERRAFGRGDRGSKPPPPFRNLGNFVHPTLPLSFGRDSKSRWSLLSGVYARGRKNIAPREMEKKPVMDSSREGHS